MLISPSIRDGTKMRSMRMMFAFGSIALANLACGESRISGTYLAHGDEFAGMLQLTQTENGHVVGVMTTVNVNTEGNLNSRACQLTGAIDAGQISLLCHYGVLDEISLGTC